MSIISIALKISLILNAPNIYHVDSYRYLYEANEFATHGIINYSINLPFILFLSIFLKIFSGFLGIINASRICVLTMSTILVIITFLLGTKLAGNVYGFLVGLFVIFNPYILTYSIVPHNDIFALTLGMIALLFLTSHIKHHHFLSTFFFYSSLFTRPDVALSLLFPIIILFYSSLSYMSTKKRLISIMLLFFLPSIIGFYLARSSLYQSRFNLIQMFITFIKPSSFRIVLKNLFTFCDISIINKMIVLFIGFGIILGVLKILNISIQIKMVEKKRLIFYIKSMDLSFIKRIITFSLFLFFITYLVVIVVMGFSYTIQGEIVNINPYLNPRRLIPLSLVLSYPFAYPIYFIITRHRSLFLNKRIKVYVLPLLVLIISSQLCSMGLYAFKNSKDASKARGTIVEASNWLSNNLNNNENALVPSPYIFNLIQPELTDRLLSYELIWHSAGAGLHANLTKDDILKVRGYLIEFLIRNPQIRYLVRDWNNPYTLEIFEINESDELNFLIKETNVIDFTLSTGWSGKVTIYERKHVNLTNDFDLSHPQKYFSEVRTRSNDTNIYFDSNGVTIEKLDKFVKVFFILKETMNFSEECIVSVKFKQSEFDEKDLGLNLVLYYDKNSDGFFSDYDTDYVQYARFSHEFIRESMLVNEWHTVYKIIPKADDPIIHFAIELTGNVNATVTIAEIKCIEAYS